MARFPLYSEIPYGNPLTIEFETKTLFSTFDDMGEEQRKKKLIYPRRNITASYQGVLGRTTNIRTLWQFYLDRGGAFESFNFFLSHPGAALEVYTREYVGTGNGTKTVWNLPSKNATNYTLYINTNIQTSGTDFTFSQAGGADGADKITMASPPSDGDRLLFSFTGMLKVRSRFFEDKLSMESFYDRLANFGIKLKGLLNE